MKEIFWIIVKKECQFLVVVDVHILFSAQVFVCKFIEKLLLILSELSLKKKKKGNASFVAGFISQETSSLI